MLVHTKSSRNDAPGVNSTRRPVMDFANVVRRVVFSVLRFRTLGTRMVAIDDDDNIVLVRETYGSTRWTLPGGGVHRGETLQDAALREAREEAGLIPNDDADIRLLGVFLKQEGQWRDHIAVYVMRGWTMKFRPSREIAQCERFPLDALPAELSPAAARRIDEIGGASLSQFW
jgi:ADP-ribose pyrophosphatase YjhB (NUDIX family)